MKITLSLLFCIIMIQFGWCQDSILISNHPAVATEIESCKRSNDKLQCLDRLIELYLNGSPNGKTYRAQALKRERALVIYNINAGWVSTLRGNCEQGSNYFSQANTHMDSLKAWGKYDYGMQSIEQQLDYFRHDWCYRTYHVDSATFYACDCKGFFPELDTIKIEKPISTDSIIITDDPRTLPPKRNKLFGKLLVKNTLRIAPQFILDQTSTDYFNKNQSLILSKLSKTAFPEIEREMLKRTDSIVQDTLIIKIEITPEQGTISKKCSVVYSTCATHLSQYYVYDLLNMDLLYPRDPISIYIPLVIRPLEPNTYYNLDQVTLGDDHFLIQYEKIKPNKLH